MNQQVTTYHEFHGFKWENINIYLILTGFVCNLIPFLARWNMITPIFFWCFAYVHHINDLEQKSYHIILEPL
jgi:hypothetical protein